MTANRAAPVNSVQITVELFGMARMRTGINALDLKVAANATLPDITSEMARLCPSLLGDVLVDVEGGQAGPMLQQGYAINRNGLEFLPDDANAPLELRAGDALLLLSNQAGG
jgi:hypothetical protein